MRNLVLAAIAGFVVGLGRVNIGPSAVTWLGTLTTVQRLGLLVGVLLAALLMALVWFLVQVLRQQGRLLLRLEAVEKQLTAGGGAPTRALDGLPVGTLAPAFGLPDLTGETKTLDTLRADGKPILLIFADPDCGPCQELLPEIGRWQRAYAGKLTLAILSRGTPKANKVAGQAAPHVLLQQDREVAKDYQVRGTPSAVLVLPDSTIGSPPATKADGIYALIARVVDTAMPLNTPMNGYTATAAELS